MSTTTITYGARGAPVVHHERDCEMAEVCNGSGQPVALVRTCGGVYQCATCGRLFGYCHGAHDDTDTEQENASCDECWAHIKAMKGE